MTNFRAVIEINGTQVSMNITAINIVNAAEIAIARLKNQMEIFEEPSSIFIAAI
jgi:hypothetical protein